MSCSRDRQTTSKRAADAPVATHFWEENASVEGGEHIDEEIQKRGWAGLEFYAFRQPTSISKEDRIGKLEPDFRAGKILFMMDRWYRMYDMHRSEAEGTSPKATRRARKRVRMDRDLVQDFLNDEYLVMTMAGAPSHDDMLDCLANIENPELKRKIVWPIAPRQEPKSGGYYRHMERNRRNEGGGLFGR